MHPLWCPESWHPLPPEWVFLDLSLVNVKHGLTRSRWFDFHPKPWISSRECGNEPGDSLKGSSKGWFIGYSLILLGTSKFQHYDYTKNITPLETWVCLFLG